MSDRNPKISSYVLPCILGFLLSAGTFTWLFLRTPDSPTNNIVFLLFLFSAVLTLVAMKLYATAMRNAVQELTTGRNRLELAIESSNAGVYEYLVSSLECTYVSEQWSEIFGVSLHELPDMKGLLPWWHKQIHPDDYESVAVAHEQFLIGKRKDLSIEFRQKHSSGEDRYVEILAQAAERDKEGAIVKVTGVLRDITERKTSEIRLKQLNRILRAIRDINKLIVSEKDPGEFLQKACDIIYNAKGFYTVWATYIDEEQKARSCASAGFGKEFQEMAAALKEGEFHGHCSTALSHGGDPLISINPGKNCPRCPLATYYQKGMGIICRLESSGTVLGLLVASVERGFASNPEEVALIKEIADDMGFALHKIELTRGREKMLAKLKQNENKYRTLVENIPQKIYIKDANSIYVSCNQNYADFLGIRPEEIAGKTDYDFYPKALAGKYRMNDVQVMTTHITEEFEEEYPDKEKVYWNHIIKSPVTDERGAITGVLGVVWDITERKEAEKEKELLGEELRQTQKLEALGTLTGGIAHDFNNILSSVLGFAEVLEQDLGDPLQQNHARQIIEGGNRAKELIAQLLLFSRRSKSVKSPFQFSSLAKEVMKLLRATFPSSITINTRILPDTGCVHASPSHLHNLLMNLCMNAYQAMGEKGTLEVSLESIETNDELVRLLPANEAGKYLKLSVKDSGSGMSKEVQKKMFEPFFTTREVGKGSGLGLSTVYGIVEELNGAIRCRSSLGKGTCFDVYLPEVEAPPEVEVKKVVCQKKKVVGTILMVDDEASIVMIWSMVAKRLGCNVVAATSSTEALEMFKKEPDRFDLVISDMTMPDMTGDILATEILETRRDIPVILCTGLTSRIPDDFIRDNDILLMTKPVSKVKLEEAIIKALALNS